MNNHKIIDPTHGRANWHLSDDRAHMVASLPSTPPSRWRMDAAKLSEFIGHLGMCRSQMVPLFNREPENPIMAIQAPRLFVTREASTGNAMMHVLDPRFGWISMAIPKADAIWLGEALLGASGAKMQGNEAPV